MNSSELPIEPGAPEGARPSAARPDDSPSAASATRRGWLRAAASAIFALLRDLVLNLLAGVQLLLLLKPRGLRPSSRQLFAVYLLTLAAGLAYDIYAVGDQPGRFDVYALPAASFWALGVLLAAGWIGGLRADARLRLPLAAAGFTIVFWASVAACALAVAADRSTTIDRWYGALSWVPLGWAAFAFGVGAARLAAVSPRRSAMPAFLVAALLILAPQWAVDPAARLWVADAGADADSAGGPGAPQAEQTLYGQMDLLGDALDAIAPAHAGVTELFTISFGGDGSQDVFLNEAIGADAVMSSVFDSGDHAIVLANSRAHAQERPFATLSSLQRALATIADRMNIDEDVLAVFLTSHGTPDHHLVVALSPYEFDDLTPEALRGLLDEAGIRYRVIIISACYSGGFIDALAGPDTMIITASGADRTSFGCRDGADWTDFGRAYFAEALAQTASFEGAFRIAARRIAEREARDHLQPSQPQISVGAGIRGQLQRLETRRGGRILFAAHESGARRAVIR